VLWSKNINSSFLYCLVGGVFLTGIKGGTSYLVGNQTTYLLYGLRLFDPTFIPQDWYTWDAFPYHFAFGYLVYFLQFIGPLHITTVIVQFFTMTALSFGLLILSKRFCRYPVPVYIALLTWMGVHSSPEIGLGWQSLILGHFEPSEIAGSLMVLGLALLLNRQYFFSGVTLGVAGIFHAAILASFAPIIFATVLAKKIWKSPKHLMSFSVPLILFWGIFVLVVGNVLLHSSPDPSATSIIINLRNDGDLNIFNWSMKWTLHWFIFAGIGSMAIWALPVEKKFKELRISFFASLLFIILTVAQMALLKIDSITSLMLWRAAPWIIVLGLLIALDRCIDILIMTNGELQKKDKLFITFLIIAGVMLVISGWGPFDSKARFLWIMSFPLTIGASYILTKLQINKISRLKIFISFLLIILLWGSKNGITNAQNHASLPTLNQNAEFKMESWVRENTPKNAVFIIPTQIEYMRVRARRAVVVEWKSTSTIPADLREWYKRILDVSGFPYATSPTELSHKLLKDGYSHLDTARAKSLQNRYGAKFIVVSNDHKGNLDDLIIRYQNEEYRILEIPY